MSDLISVICTVKNGEKTISTTLNSVVEQTYKNWQMVIVDDGSTDGTKQILNYYASINPRIKVYFSGGVGRGKALNTAIKLASGKYIANIDADDVMHPQKLEIQIKIINNQKELFLVSTDSKLIYDNEKPAWKTINEKDITTIKVGQKLLVRNIISHPSVIINKEMLEELGMYDETRKSQLDYELWLRAFMQDKKMLVIKEDLIAKRIHENQSFENKKRIKYTLNSSILQLRYLMKRNRYFFLLPIPVITFIASLLPFQIRRKISKIILNERI